MKFPIIIASCIWGLNCYPLARPKVAEVRTAKWLHALEERTSVAPELMVDLCRAWPSNVEPVKQLMRNAGITSGYLSKDQRFIGTLAGCNSYFELTDMDLDKTFAKLREAYPEKMQLHCISVGFLQPWIMVAEMHCTRLTVLDVNPHIIRMQQLLYQAMSAEGSNFNPRKFLEAQRFPFAVSKAIAIPQMDQVLTAEDICASPRTEYCLDRLVTASGRLNSLQRVEFVRGALQDISQVMDSDGSDMVVYTSNALDPGFMSSEEFARFWRAFSDSIQAKKKGFLVYHMASSPSFGIYGASQNNGIQVFCSDRFIVTPEPIHDPCYPKPIQPAAYEMLTWPDRFSGQKINGKNRYCLQTDGTK
ncbi:MAG: hypothetical protein ACOY5B_10420 [Spirochaetota bacterium]